MTVPWDRCLDRVGWDVWNHQRHKSHCTCIVRKRGICDVTFHERTAKASATAPHARTSCLPYVPFACRDHARPHPQSTSCEPGMRMITPTHPHVRRTCGDGGGGGGGMEWCSTHTSYWPHLSQLWPFPSHEGRRGRGYYYGFPPATLLSGCFIGLAQAYVSSDMSRRGTYAELVISGIDWPVAA